MGKMQQTDQTSHKGDEEDKDMRSRQAKTSDSGTQNKTKARSKRNASPKHGQMAAELCVPPKRVTDAAACGHVTDVTFVNPEPRYEVKAGQDSGSEPDNASF